MSDAFATLLNDPNLKAEDPRLKRYVYPSGTYQGQIVDMVPGETKPREKGKDGTPFFEVHVKLEKVISVEPSRVDDATKAIQFASANVTRSFYLTQRALPMWTEFLLRLGLGNIHPIREAKKVVGSKVLVRMVEEYNDDKTRTFNKDPEFEAATS